MGVHNVIRRGPGEHRKPAILGCDQRNGVALVIDKLSGRQMPRIAEVRRLNDQPIRAFDGFRDQNSVDAA